ncbi:type II toxin-antitoxin system PemK/MazF family toxin [Limosilactobacillus kribbianus]|uniref:type II toxin-antitoxin system PemK/MazF family toxin n=1 Tax=Limosilactobacillus kribbianus TaxID=2982695 RepID=UPI0022652E14|nr:type II toxin-antitoxin system PemK/MazF family toxin [Limosilactobacillus kribbianus]
MNSYKDLQQGQIVMVDFNPTNGHEQKGYRPAFIMSNSDFNQLCGGMVKVCPITSNEKPFPLHLKLPALDNIHGVVELDQERTLDLSDRKFKVVDQAPTEFIEKVKKINFATY